MARSDEFGVIKHIFVKWFVSRHLYKYYNRIIKGMGYIEVENAAGINNRKLLITISKDTIFNKFIR